MNVNLMIRILESFKGYVYMCMYICYVRLRTSSVRRRPVKYKGTTATLKTKIIKRHRENGKTLMP